ncbi:putative nuclease HARBI1 [Lineus longissimus]|uniref:putative nuclease HARBI1 n=1 Tax=Lineus longissimus TaxID=88925 RepID=UPI00315CBBE8
MARLIRLADELGRRQMRRERVFRDRTNPLERYDDSEIYDRFRFRREDTFELTDMLGDEIKSPTNRNHSIRPVLCILTALRFYATGNYHLVTGDLFGIHRTTASRMIRRVSDSLARRLDDTSQNEFEYVNRKGVHSINAQAICDSGNIFLNGVIRWPGGTHDSRILTNSEISRDFETGRISGFLIGDSGYPLRQWLMTPLYVAANRKERRYNTSHKRTRSVIERTFGIWKRRFHCLHNKLRMTPERCCVVIAATMVLHNIAMRKGLPDFDDEIPDEMEDIHGEYDGQENGQEIRRQLIDNVFA